MPFSPRSPAAAPVPGRPAPSRRTAVVIWSALLLGLCVFVGVAIGLAPLTPARPGRDQLGTLFVGVAAVIVTLDLSLSFVIPRRMRAPPGATPDGFALTRTIVACALAEGGGLVCSVFYLIAAEPLLLVLLVPCLAVLARWFPSEARWARLAQVPGAPGGSAEPPRRSLVRE